MQQASLETAIRSLTETDDLPLPLPPVHVSIARWFSSIVGKGNLEPTLCHIFHEDLLYLFYGGVFYRTGQKPTRNAAELPIVFLFDPAILSFVTRYYPFDTGAMAAGHFGVWSTKFDLFKEMFKVPGRQDFNTPCRMVYHIFGNNSQYLLGRVNSDCRNKPDPLPQLFDFMSSDLSNHHVDQRQCMIECQVTRPITLERNLLWLAFPESMTDIFAKLYELTKPSIPDYYAYASHVIFTASEIAAQLQLRASEVVKRYERLPFPNQ